MTPEERKQLKEVHAFMKSMERYDTIPFTVDKAMARRIKRTLEFQQFSISGKNANSEDQTIDEGGIAVVSVMGDPDGFLEVQIGPTTYYLPYFT